MKQNRVPKSIALFIILLVALSPTAFAFELGTIMQPDIYDPQQLNRYAYVRNNPVKYTDPSGHYGSVLDYLDYISLADSIYNFYDDPNLETLFWLEIDIAYTIIPVIGGVGFASKGMRYGVKYGDEVAQGAAKVAGKSKAGNVAEEGIEGVSKQSKKAKKAKDVSKAFKDTAKGKIGTTEWVDVDELWTRQPHVREAKADYFADLYKSEGYQDLPPIHIVEVNGRKIIANGNHRFEGARRAGAEKIKVIYDDAVKEAEKWDGSMEQFYRKSHRGDYSYD